MRSTLIVGSGPSAAGAALALARTDDCQITVIDVGLNLEQDNRGSLQRLAALPRDQWSENDLRVIGRQPLKSPTGGVPQKYAYGSDFAYREAGQRSGVAVGAGLNDALISGAYGGFSNVWGAGVLPFPDTEFAGWPVSAGEMAPHYRAVLSAIPFSAARDDLADELPLHADFTPLPGMSARARRILDAYEGNRPRLHQMGVWMGQSRIALRAAACIRCGRCLTGCPYSLIYSSADTFDDLRRRGRINYHPNLLAVGLQEHEGRPRVTATNLQTQERHQFEADRVYIACGAIGTTRLVLGALKRFGEDVEVQESAQFIVPFASARPIADPRRDAEHALAQLFLLLKLPQAKTDPVHISLYTYSSAFNDALPAWARPFAGQAFRRLSAGLGFLPSSWSPKLRVRLTGPETPGQLAPMSVLPAGDGRRRGRAALAQVTRQLLRAAPRLDLWPVLPRVALAPLGKSYHWGGSFPHSEGNGSSLSTDRLGRLPAWKHIHLVDPSVLPSIAATTFTLTAMANAHRIAEESLTQNGTSS